MCYNPSMLRNFNSTVMSCRYCRINALRVTVRIPRSGKPTYGLTQRRVPSPHRVVIRLSCRVNRKTANWFYASHTKTLTNGCHRRFPIDSRHRKILTPSSSGLLKVQNGKNTGFTVSLNGLNRLLLRIQDGSATPSMPSYLGD